jgi:predicted nucleotidyltransferase
MLKEPPTDAVLAHFRTAVDETYGDRLERVVLFGSRARGQAQPDSDYDIAVFLRDLQDREAEMNRLADIATDILYQDGEFIHAMPYRAGSYNDQTTLMQEIRAEGIDL